MTFDNTNRGTLGKNKNPKSDKSPEYNGRINVNGVDYYLNGWVKENKNTGEKFFALSVKPIQETAAQGVQQARNQIVAKTQDGSVDIVADFDDDIPF